MDRQTIRLLNLISTILWVAGTALVILSWLNVVSRQTGWVGFGIAIAGTVLSWIITSLTKHRPN